MIEIHADKAGYSVPIGRRGENETRVVIFDVVSEWRKSLGDGVVELLVRRQSDSVPYPAVVTLDGDTARWVVRAADVYVPGSGKMELNYIIGGQVVKSKQYKTFVESSMGDSDTEPPEQGWVDGVLKAGASAQDGAVRAENAAVRAEKTSQEIGTSAEDAKNAALDAQKSSKSAKESAAAAELSAKMSADSAVLAEQAAAGNGYMSFEVDESGDLIFKKTANVTQVEFGLKEGELIVYG